MSQLTDSQIIDRGLAAANLLSDTTFQSVIKDLCYEQFCAFTETRPEEKAKREDIYNIYQGLQAIESELTSRVHSKDLVVDRIDADNAERDSDDTEAPLIIKGDTNQ